MGRRLVWTVEQRREVSGLLALGWNPAQIARVFGCSPPAMRQMIVKWGLRRGNG